MTKAFMISQEELKHAYDLLDFIQASPSPFHTVQSVKDRLIPHGFQELTFKDRWSLEADGKYIVTRNGSAVIAFVLGEAAPEEAGFHLVGAHTDSPTFRLKPSPIIPVEGKYVKLNVETYGGPILNTWLDRPLSLAGRVMLKGKSPFQPRHILVQSPSPLLVIPNLAIHLNRKINEGIELNKQKDLLPLFSMQGGDPANEEALLDHLADLIHVQPDEIVDFDVFLFEYESGSILGLNQEFISSSRLDDLAMVHAGTWALVQTRGNRKTAVLACFDHEEVGSTSKQGAASPFLSSVLERIMLALGKEREDYFQALARSFMISADMAHALHPNAGDKYDPVNKPVLNGGPVIKISANMSYTSDAESTAVFKGLCEEAGVPVQIFVNRSDEQGGSTIGPILSTHLDIRSVDVGNPLLAMHSVRELGGVKDHWAMSKVFRHFYSY